MLQVLLSSDKGVANFSDRSLLKNLGHWLGMLTLARNKPILQLVHALNISSTQSLEELLKKIMEYCILLVLDYCTMFWLSNKPHNDPVFPQAHCLCLCACCVCMIDRT